MLKGNFIVLLQPIILYHSECWPLKGQLQNKNKNWVAEASMIWWMSSNHRRGQNKKLLYEKIDVGTDHGNNG